MGLSEEAVWVGKGVLERERERAHLVPDDTEEGAGEGVVALRMLSDPKAAVVLLMGGEGSVPPVPAVSAAMLAAVGGTSRGTRMAGSSGASMRL